MLGLCDDLQRLRSRLTDPELRRDARARLRRQARNKVDRLAADLSTYRFRGPLGQVLREFRFEVVHFQVLATLLHGHLRSENAALEGRVILSSIFDNSFDVLQGMSLLHENSPLRASGLVVLADDEECPDDVLEARFRISEDALQTFQEEIQGLVVEDQRSLGTRPYESHRAYLQDLRILHNLFKHRSERVFHQDRWDRVHATSPTPGAYLTRRIEAFGRRIASRLEQTANADSFPAVRFFREHALLDEELIVVVHLLFKELYEGNAYADTAELVRLVSCDELSLLRNRRLFLASGTLRRREIVQIEPMLENRELTGEVYLADWVVNYLLGVQAGVAEREESIAPDERLDWHLYLKNLDDAHSFFRDLEAN
jgi:hypothetical protein